MVNLLVNAGGASRRMGRTKALLPVPPDDSPLIAHIMRRLLPLVTAHIVVVTDDDEVAEVARATGATRIVADSWRGGGALGGVASGLALCPGWTMVVACDMPLVSVDIFAKLIARTATTDALAIIPRSGGFAQPFHGLWHFCAQPSLAAQVDAGDLAIHHALARLPICWLDEDELGAETDDAAFWNVNTPDEWTKVLAVLTDQNRPITE